MIGERVRLARESCGLTQRELADIAQVPLGTLQDLEAGRTLTPAAEVIDRVAMGTGYPRGFFLRSRPLPDVPEGNFRRLKRGTSKVGKQIRAEVRQLLEIVQEAEGVLRLPPVGLEPIPADPFELDDVEHVAMKVRANMGIDPRSPIPNVIRAAERAGVVVVFLNYPMEDHDGYSVWPDYGLGGRPVIAVSASRPGDRNRSTVSHELGHLILHTLRRGVDRDRAEKEAFRFAGAFLLPRKVATEAMRPPVTLGVLKAVKANFGTSIAMNAQRALDLQLIDRDHFISLRKQMSKRGWLRDEPIHVAAEKPVLIGKTVEALAGPGSTRQRAQQIGLPLFRFGLMAS